MSDKPRIDVLIQTKNEEVNLPHALASVAGWTRQVFVLDSGSTDNTAQVAQKFGATFVHHAWEGYARQKNWALDHLPWEAPWIFILDADETITPELRDELIRVAAEDRVPENGFYVNRRFFFLGHRIRHCGYYPSWNLRSFAEAKRYEDRSVHEHMILDGPAGYLRHEMEHYDRRGLDYYIAKHDHYAALEAAELYRVEQGVAQGTMHFSFWSGPIERRRWIKHKIWPHLPAKWFFRWVYMYVLRLGFLDGATGFRFCALLASYERKIGMKLKDLRRLSPSPGTPGEGRGEGPPAVENRKSKIENRS